MAAVRVDPTKVHEFVNEQRFDAWLRRHWNKETEVWIKIHKVRSGLASITPAQAIDVALTWGWIDAIRKGFDDQSFLQRYCPRGKKSVWSQINVANVERLIAAKRMHPSGMAQVEAAKADGRWSRAYRVSTTEAPPDLLAAIRARPKARAMYEKLSAQNRFALTFRVLALRTEAGRKKRIAAFVEMLERGETIYPNKAPRPRRPAGRGRSQRGSFSASLVRLLRASPGASTARRAGRRVEMGIGAARYGRSLSCWRRRTSNR